MGIIFLSYLLASLRKLGSLHYESQPLFHFLILGCLIGTVDRGTSEREMEKSTWNQNKKLMPTLDPSWPPRVHIEACALYDIKSHLEPWSPSCRFDGGRSCR